MVMSGLGAGLALLQYDPVVEIVHSPYIVPVAGTVMVLCVSVAKIWSGVRTREMQSQERLAAISKGLPVPPEPLSLEAAERYQKVAAATGLQGDGLYGAKERRAGIILLSIGVGLMLFFVCLASIIAVREVLIPAAAGLIPAALGVGFLVEGGIRGRQSAGLVGRVAPSGGQAFAAGENRAPLAPPPLYTHAYTGPDVPRAANGEPETTTLKPYEQDI